MDGRRNCLRGLCLFPVVVQNLPQCRTSVLPVRVAAAGARVLANIAPGGGIFLRQPHRFTALGAVHNLIRNQSDPDRVGRQ